MLRPGAERASHGGPAHGYGGINGNGRRNRDVGGIHARGHASTGHPGAHRGSHSGADSSHNDGTGDS